MAIMNYRMKSTRELMEDGIGLCVRHDRKEIGNEIGVVELEM